MVNRGFCSSVGFTYELDCSCFRRNVQDSVFDTLEGKREGCFCAGSTQRRPVLFSPAPARCPAVRRPEPSRPWCPGFGFDRLTLNRLFVAKKRARVRIQVAIRSSDYCPNQDQFITQEYNGNFLCRPAPTRSGCPQNGSKPDKHPGRLLPQRVHEKASPSTLPVAGFRSFVLPKNCSGHLSPMPRGARGTVVSGAKRPVGIPS